MKESERRLGAGNFIVARTPLAVIRDRTSIALAGMLALTGCWTAPVASVQPTGAPRLIQDGIPVQARKSSAIVRSVDATSRRLILSIPGDAESVSYRVGPEVRALDRIKVGDKVCVKIAEELAVYVLRDGYALSLDGAPEVIASNARVLSVDPSYRLLTLQFPNGHTESFKVDRLAKLDEMASGDDVVIRPVEILALKGRH